MLADPDFTQKCMDGDEAQIRRCLRCYKCFPGSPEEGYDDLPFTSEQLAVYVGHCTINPTAHYRLMLSSFHQLRKVRRKC